MVAASTPVSMVMSTLDLATVGRGAPLQDVWELLRKRRVQHVPVLDGDTLVGLVSSWDLARLAMENDGAELSRLPVERIMERNLVTLHAKDTVAHAAELLAEASFHSLPVVDDYGALIGILTTSDVLQCLLGAP
jgi:CBS domain-containing protein